MDILEEYKILKNNLIINKKKIPKTFFPIPTEEDYLKGKIIRYFIQKRDSKTSPIFEVNKQIYSECDFPYKAVFINWYIRGEIEEKWENNIYYPSITTLNANEIKNVEEEMPELKFYLVDLQQFWKPL